MGRRFGDPGAIHAATLAGGGARVGEVRVRPSGPRGFTLLELLITMSVTTIGLVGLLSLHLSVVRGNDGASRFAEAQQITASRLESLRAQRFDKMMETLTGITPAPPPPEAPDTTKLPVPWTVAGRANMTYTVTASASVLSSVSSSLIKIRVVTTWTEGGGTFGTNPTLDHTLALEVIRTRDESL